MKQSEPRSNLVGRLLRRNTSAARIAGFALSNFIGLAIMAAGLQFYLDARSIWQQKDSFLKSDYLAINKIIDASNTIGGDSSEFSAEEIADLQAQPWVEKVGEFTRADFRVYAGVSLGNGDADDSSGRRMFTAMFFESVPDDFLDISDSSFFWNEDSREVPIIISKDYLALYNFGFAGAAGLPQLSESLISGIPLNLTLSDDSGAQRISMPGRIAGYSNRFNTILVPQSFLDSMNERLGSPVKSGGRHPSRLIVDVNSPGDSAIAPYLKAHGYEVAGDNTSSSATFMLRIVSGIIIGIGSVITLLSLFILVLSMSLLMEKNRRKLHSLLMLGYRISDVARPYRLMTLAMSLGAAAAAILCTLLLRAYYISPLRSLGAEGASPLWAILLAGAMTALIIAVNFRSIRRRVMEAWKA